MSETASDSISTNENLSDGMTDLQRLMSKKAEDHTPESIAEIARILRSRRNLYAMEEAEKATKPKKEPKEPKEKAPPKPRATKAKTATEIAADSLAGQLSLEDLGDLGL